MIDQLIGRILITEGTFTDLTKSLAFSQPEKIDLKNLVKVLQKSDTEKQVEIDNPRSTIVELQQCANYQEDYTRRNNLCITGLQEIPGGETWKQTPMTVSKLLEETPQLPLMKRACSPCWNQERLLLDSKSSWIVKPL